MIKAEYIWIGGCGEFRSKTKMMYSVDNNIFNLADTGYLNHKNYPSWDYDGSSTKQASGDDSEVLLRPVRVWNDPFVCIGSSQHLVESLRSTIVLCETIYPDGTYPKTSTRHKACEIFDKKLSEEPWFGIEQEFYMLTKHGLEPSDGLEPCDGLEPSDAIDGGRKYENHKALGQFSGEFEPQGRYYCGVGGTNVFGREIVTDTFNRCISMGLNVSGMNAEVGPGQWEIQIGPCEGIDAGDQILMLRYILYKVSENYNVEIVLDPKPLGGGNWNGSGCHTNYSTKDMRDGRWALLHSTADSSSADSSVDDESTDESAAAMRKDIDTPVRTGLECIYDAIEKLKSKHSDHMKIYGSDNEQRMTGLHETAGYDTFSSGVADRSASIRIPRSTASQQKGYLEDRRPGANMDPYLVTSKIFETTIL